MNVLIDTQSFIWFIEDDPKLPTKINDHKDPFDRVIISQSISENIPIISSDGNFKKYPVQIIW